jgi:hypothetical protein
MLGRRSSRTSSVRRGSLRSSVIRAARGTHPVGGGVPATGPPGAPSRGLVDGHEPHGSRHDAATGWGPPCLLAYAIYCFIAGALALIVL